MQVNFGNTQARHSSVSGGLIMKQRKPAHRGLLEKNDSKADQMLVDQIEKLVLEGNQKGIANFFEDWPIPPARIGEWELRVNVRLLDGVSAGRTIHAIPMSVRTRAIFEQGSITRLINIGFTQEQAQAYYKHAFRKKYVWVDSVLEAVKEMINGFQNDTVLKSYEIAGDPRRLAMTTGIPANPYLTSHSHFLVAIAMARLMIGSRLEKEVMEIKVPVRQHEQKAVSMVAV